MDRTVGETFYIMFTTRIFATGIPGTLAGSPVVSAYENEGLTQITAGITLGVDHDGVTGLNLLTIVATGGNGFEAGKDYNLVITTGTVSGVSVVGEVVGTFSLGLSAAFTRLGAPAGASVSADIATVDSNVDSILTDTADMQPKLGSPAADVSADIAAVKVDTAAILVDTADMQPKLGTPAGASISADIAVIEGQTDDIGVAGAGLTDLGGMSTGMKAEVNTEAADVLKTDTVTLPGQAAPSNTPTMEDILGWLYKAFRNKKTQTSTEWALFDDAGSTVDSKATVSDAAGTATKTEIVSGP